MDYSVFSSYHNHSKLCNTVYILPCVIMMSDVSKIDTSSTIKMKHINSVPIWPAR